MINNSIIYKFFEDFTKYIQNLKYNVKRTCIFHLILVSILSILILSVENRGRGGFQSGDKICLAQRK